MFMDRSIPFQECVSFPAASFHDILVFSVSRYGYMPYGVFEKLGIPGPKPSLFWGTLLKHDNVSNRQI